MPPTVRRYDQGSIRASDHPLGRTPCRTARTASPRSSARLPDGIDQAIRNGLARAASTLRHVDWFEVTQMRGQVKDGDVEHFQVGMKVGFRLEDE